MYRVYTVHDGERELITEQEVWSPCKVKFERAIQGVYSEPDTKPDMVQLVLANKQGEQKVLEEWRRQS